MLVSSQIPPQEIHINKGSGPNSVERLFAPISLLRGERLGQGWNPLRSRRFFAPETSYREGYGESKTEITPDFIKLVPKDFSSNLPPPINLRRRSIATFPLIFTLPAVMGIAFSPFVSATPSPFRKRVNQGSKNQRKAEEKKSPDKHFLHIQA